MRRVWITMIFIAVTFCAASQESTPKPEVSRDSLTSEQIAVYRAVLTHYLKDSDGALNLADTTQPLDQSDKACIKGIEMSAKEQARLIHKLEPSLVAHTKIVLVDSERQRSTVEQNDPQNLMKKAIDDHERVTHEQVDQSVKQAFQSGLFTLSEIAFDKERRHAVVAYSFVCGMLCGHGNTLVLKKIGQDWRVTRTCGGWIS